MATLVITSNGYTLDGDLSPELPVEREDVLIADDQRMSNGQLRRAMKGTDAKKRLKYGRRNLTEAQRATWFAAHPWGTSYSHTDELGITRTVMTMARRDPLSRTKPSAPGTPAYYDVSVEVEEV